MRLAWLCLAWTALALARVSAASLTVQIEPREAAVGDPITLTLTVQDGSLGKVDLPSIDGLQVAPNVDTIRSTSFSSGILTNSTARSYHLTATRSGDFTIPTFDVPLLEGGTLRFAELKIHVRAPIESVADSPPPAPTLAPTATTNAAPAGPVILPPASSAPATGPLAGVVSVPRDRDGGPSRVFMLITPETTEAYVDQTVALRMDFYIRMEVNADQNSLPTIKGSNFLMNDFAVRGHATIVAIEGESYECDTWLTSISAPKPGDFTLAAERDTYWVKSQSPLGFDPFGAHRGNNLAHEFITSNQYTLHIHALPDEGRPPHFDGAVGQFHVMGTAQPATVAWGEPVELDYSISGQGNFDHVKCPALPEDAAWKTYTPTSHINYQDESRTRATKIFQQSVIPLKSGSIALPSSTFSFFDPVAKQYVTVPIPLPPITVTAATAPTSGPAGPTDAASSSSASPVATDALFANRPELGSLQTDLVPAYRHSWFWTVQGILLSLPIVGLLIALIQRRIESGRESEESMAHRRSLNEEEEAMKTAVQRDDTRAFFLAARHLLQLQLGARWKTPPEAITLAEVRRRDPGLAEQLSPLFAQADEIIYSGRMGAKVDLADWERRVHDLLRLQPA